MGYEQNLEILESVPLLKEIDEGDRKHFAKISILRSVEEGGFFFMQGDKADYVHILSSGLAKLCKITADGQQANLRTIHPYQMFGAIGAVDSGSMYPACAQALENSSALAIQSTIFHEVIEKSPELSFALMNLMTGYIREMQERFTDVVTTKVEERLGRIIIRLASQSGVKSEDGLYLELPFTHQDLAEMIGTTQYSISRILTSWEKNGIIKIQRKKLLLPNLHAFVKLFTHH